MKMSNKSKFQLNTTLSLCMLLYMVSCQKPKKEFISYPDYYRHYTKVKFFLDNDQSDKAVVLFDSISVLIPHVPSYHLFNMARSCADNGKCERSARYLKWALENGQEYANGIGAVVTIDACKPQINEIIENENKIHRKHFNYKYKAIIDSMFKKDQEMRINVNYPKMRNIDSLNKKSLLHLIYHYGYPSESIIGEASAFNAFIMLLHMDSDLDNKILKPILYKAYNDGYLSPLGLAWITDRRRCWRENKLEPYYYHMPSENYGSLTKIQIDEINRRRDSIGLQPK
jgi:hypothetical protein